MEIWKEIFPGYEVSNLGRIKSFKRGEPKILSPYVTVNGSEIIDLWIDGQRRHLKISRLVAKAFIPNPKNFPEVKHLNGNKLDNRAENLQWVKAVGNLLSTPGEDNPNAKLTNEQVRYIRDNPERLTQIQLGEMFGVAQTTISSVQRGEKYKSAGGTIRESQKHPKRVPNDIRDEIRRLYVRSSSEFGCYALAKKFNVSPQTILNIIREKSD